MKRKIVWLVCLVVLVTPLLLVGCGEDEGVDITNISNESGDSSGSRLVVDNENNLHVVWFDLATGVNQVMYAEKTPTSSWTKPLNLSDSFSNSRSPKIVADDQDTVHVVWHEYADGKFRIFYSQKPSGGTWSEPYDITRSREAATYPAITLDKQGNVYVAWEEDKLKQDTELYYTDIYYSKRNSDGTWTDPVNISNNDSDSRYPSIALDSQNNLDVLWEDDLTGKQQVYYASVTKDGVLSQAVEISNSTADSSDPIYPVLVIDSEDTLHAAWHDMSSGNWEILYCFKTEGEQWSQPENISKDVSNSGVPALTLDNRDTLYLVWNDDSPGNFDIFMTAKPRDGTWSKVVNVSKTADNSGDPSIAVDNLYHVHITWSEYSKSSNNWDIVYTSRLGIGAD